MMSFLKRLFFLGSACLAAARLSAESAQPFLLFPNEEGRPVALQKVASPYRTDGKPWRFAYGKPLTIRVDAGAETESVTPWFFGNNVAWWNGKKWFLDPDRIEKAKQAGIRFWRWPGGSSSDEYVWDGNYGSFDTFRKKGGGRRSNMNADWAVDTDDFIAFCRATGSQAIVTVNYGIARVEGVARAADLAARWVEYFNKKKKFKVWYWEIGNENYGPWEFGTELEGKPRLTGAEYGRDFRVIAEAMRKVDPDIFIGAVAVDEDNGEDWTGYRWWMRDLLPEIADAADFLVLHQYFMWPFDAQNNYIHPSPEVLFQNIEKLHRAKKNVDAMVRKYTRRTEPFPIALTEYNLMNASPKETIQWINGLFTAEVLGELPAAGYRAANYWDWKNGLDEKLGGDHGMLASGDPDAPEAAPRPSYYAFALYHRAFGDRRLAVASPDPTLHVYASRFSSGEVGIVAVNETEKPRTLVIAWENFRPNGKLNGWAAQAKNLKAKVLQWNGVSGKGAGGPFPLEDIPPYRASFDPEKPVVLPIPPYSACGFVFYH